MSYIFNVVPMGKPRMTQADRWRQRSPVMRYRAYADELRAKAGSDIDAVRATLLEGARLRFVLPMAPSWSKKKRAAMVGGPHLQQPDIDNLIKGVLDSFLKQDSPVWRVCATKVWGDQGEIMILPVRV